MKALLALLLLLPAPSFAANNLFCQQLPTRPDQGYQALFSNNLRHVTISEETIAGPRRLALLNCAQYRGRISCSEPLLRDAGYSFSVQANRRGVLQGSLFAITFAGSRRLANLVCRHRH